jgi:hypothetical protein
MCYFLSLTNALGYLLTNFFEVLVWNATPLGYNRLFTRELILIFRSSYTERDLMTILYLKDIGKYLLFLLQRMSPS